MHVSKFHNLCVLGGRGTPKRDKEREGEGHSKREGPQDVLTRVEYSSCIFFKPSQNVIPVKCVWRPKCDPGECVFLYFALCLAGKRCVAPGTAVIRFGATAKL